MTDYPHSCPKSRIFFLILLFPFFAGYTVIIVALLSLFVAITRQQRYYKEYIGF